MFKTFQKVLKNQKLESNEDSKINQFIFKRYISNHPDGCYLTNFINHYDLDNKTLFEYYRCLFKGRNVSYIPYTKAETEEHLELVKTHYSCSDSVARDYLKILPHEEIQKILKQYNKS